MALRAVKPELKSKRLKMLVYGPAGIGKTTAAIQFPQSYIFDSEKGSSWYSETIGKVGSVVLDTSNVDIIREELEELLTTKHEYRTVIIDPITQVYNSCQEKWTRVFERYAKTQKEAEIQDFGPRYWGRVKAEMKSIDRLLMSLDMNVIITSHQKDIYGPGMQKIGVGPDTKKGDEYLFDLVFELRKDAGKRMAVTIKERAEIGKSKFPPEFEWSYDNFLKFYGSETIEKVSSPVVLASEAEVKKLNDLLSIVHLEEGTVSKWLSKLDVDDFSQAKSDDVNKCIAFVQKKLSQIQEEK